MHYVIVKFSLEPEYKNREGPLMGHLSRFPPKYFTNVSPPIPVPFVMSIPL